MSSYEMTRYEMTKYKMTTIWNDIISNDNKKKWHNIRLGNIYEMTRCKIAEGKFKLPRTARRKKSFIRLRSEVAKIDKYSSFLCQIRAKD